MEFGRLEDVREEMLDTLRVRFGGDTRLTGVTHLPRQASNRSYHRLHLSGNGGPATVVVMRLPDNPFSCEEATSATAARELPFCNVLKFLQGLDIPVPQLYVDAAAAGFLVLEDLGDTTMLAEIRAAGARDDVLEGLYREAIDLLCRFQAATRAPGTESGGPRGDRGCPSGPGVADCIGYGIRFDRKLLRWELDHFKEWLLLDYACARPDPRDDRAIEAAFDDIASRLAGSPYVLAHRDYQSTNLMRCGGRLVVIDFQDALMAPPAYDIVALLRDSYVVIPPGVLERLLTCYYSRAGAVLPFPDEAAFRAQFNLQALQRKLKDAGRFVFIDREKGNPNFLKYIPDSLSYVAAALKSLPEYAELHRVLAGYIRELR